MSEKQIDNIPRTNKGEHYRKIFGIILLLGMIINLSASMYLNFRLNTPRFHPKVFENEPRDGKIGTYIYSHTLVANDSRYMDDIALMADRVLIDIGWGSVMKNDSENPWDMEKLEFYDDFFKNLSARNLEIVVQFSPTRSPPSWLDIEFDMSDYRIITVPVDEEDYDRFEFQLMRYVNYTVDYYKSKDYLISPIEWCLADEPNSDTWKPIMQTMYDDIKSLDPNSIVSVVEHKKDLYTAFSGSYDMFTIDPYGSDLDLEQKIRLAYEATNEEKPVRVIVSGMARDNDYYMIRRQMVISWSMGAYDIWFWSYNSRWNQNDPDHEWYVTKYSEEGPIHTQRATAVIEAKHDIQQFAEIEKNLLNNSINTQTKEKLEDLEQSAYEEIMNCNFVLAEQYLNNAIALV